MAKIKRPSPSNLAFLDIMSCGLGAVALIFLLLKPGEGGKLPSGSPHLQAEFQLLQKELTQGKEKLVTIKNTVSDLNNKLAITEGLSFRIEEEIKRLKKSIADTNPDNSATLVLLKQQIKAKEKQQATLLKKKQSSKAASFSGDGKQQYLTGLQMSGDRILILLDSSSSMLDKNIVNIIRRRIGSDAQKSNAPKWLKAQNIVRWIMANIPIQSQYQILMFNKQVEYPDPILKNMWLSASDSVQVEKTLSIIATMSPQHGTNLQQVINTAMDMRPPPDNIFLITDGLPTLNNKKKKKNTISGNKRLELFKEATKIIPPDLSVNTILLPLEGDYLAAGAFWQLAIETQGAFLTPTEDWP